MHFWESGFSYRTPCWHGLGNIIQERPQSVQNALDLAGLNWTVSKVPLYAKTSEAEEPKERFSLVLDHQAIVRSTDRSVLGIVTPKYEPIQNKTMMDFIWELTQQEQSLSLETAGSLKSGKIVWALSLLREFEVKGIEEELNQTYVLITNSHDGSNALRVLLTGVRVVCWNTHSMAIAGADNIWSIRHIGNVHARVEECRKSLELASEWSKTDEDAMNTLAGEQCEEDLFKELMEQVWWYDEDEDDDEKAEKMERKREQLLENYNQVNDSTSLGGTKYAAFQAVAEQLDYLTIARGDDETAQNARRFERTFIDQVSLNAKSTALHLLLN